MDYMGHRIHLIKIPTTREELFPYSHYADVGHDPQMEVIWDGQYLFLRCEDLFKLKPNVQMSRKDRIDIYIPYSSARSMGEEISAYVGVGGLAHDATSSPERYRVGRQTLPLIDASKRVSYNRVSVEIAGFQIFQTEHRVFIDRERPNDGHIEMAGPEIHLGVDLSQCAFRGARNAAEIVQVTVPARELRTAGEENPIDKADGIVTLAFDVDNARALASTLCYYATMPQNE